MIEGSATPEMRRIWAPWRRKFLTHGRPNRCIFCDKPRLKNDAANYVLKRSRTTFTMLNLYPYNLGHLLIAPYRHIADLTRLRPAEEREIMKELRFATELLRRTLNAHGFNVGANIGTMTGGSFKHLHFHLVPRWRGDTNFMPVVAGDKVIAESLDELYGLLGETMRKWKTK